MPEPIAIIDCNNFFASCEAANNPSIMGKPIIVLSNNDAVIIALSNEAKSLGIEKFSPVFQAKELIKKHKVEIFSANFSLYAKISQQIMNLLKNFSPDVEEYSIDEAFVGLGGFSRFDLSDYCTKINQAIYEETKVPTTIGIASTKTLAKIANKFAKKQLNYNTNVLNLYKSEQLPYYLEQTAVEDIWGVGRQYSKLLKNRGIHNAYQFSQTPEKWVRKNMTVVGHRTHKELNQVPCVEIKQQDKDKKMIMFSRAFGTKLSEKQDIMETVAFFTARACERMRAQNSAAKFLSIYLSTSRFAEKRYFRKEEIRLPVPTDSTNEISKYALESIERLYKSGYLYYKAGVLLSGLQAANNNQTAFFDPLDRYKMAQITKAVDKINAKNGIDTVRFANMGLRNPWRQNQKHKSDSFVDSDKLQIELRRTVGFL